MENKIPDFWELTYIPIEINDKTGSAQVANYVDAKLKDLQEFGYNSLTYDEVLASTWRCHSNQIQGTNVIDQFLKSDIPVGNNF